MGKNSPSKDELARQVQQLQEKLRRLQEAAGQNSPAQPSGPPPVAEGLAENLVASLGKLVPGLQRLIDVASQVPEFHKRLASIDQEIQRKFFEKHRLLDSASREIAAGLGPRRMGIPPQVRRPRPGGPAHSHEPARRRSAGRSSPGEGPRMHIRAQTPAQLPVDVFDEGRQIVLLAEAPGLAPRDVSVSLDGTVAVIVIQAPHRQGTQRVELPCSVAGEADTSLVNGILRIKFHKAEAP